MSTEIIVNNDIIEINVTEEPIIIEAPSGAYPLPTGVYSVFGRTGVVVAQDGDYTLTLLGDVTISSPSTNQVLRYNGTTWVNATLTNTGTVTSVAATVPTGLTISGSPITTSGTLAFGLQTGYSIPTTISQGTWDTAYNRSLTSASVTGTTTKTLTLNEQGGGTITASWTDINTDAVTSVFGRTGAVVATEGDYTLTQLGDVTITTPANGQVLKYNGTTWVNGTDTDTGLTSVGLSMPSAFTVTNSPLTANGTLSVTGAGTTAQYVRGDGTLANFPTSGGGGSSVSYYFNSSVSQGTLGGVAYRELSKVPIIGAGTDITIATNGYIANYITDAGDPALLEIPVGNWNFEVYFSASSGGGSPSFYVELYKYDGTTFTLISSSSATPESITGGTAIDLYTTALAVPLTTLTLTDRLAIRVYVNNSGRTITLHTENSHLCEVITTFTTGLTALNGLTAQVQFLATGTSGTDFNISSGTATHTFNLPVASALNTGKLSSSDFTTFNNKANALSGTINTIAYWDSATTISSLALATYPSLTELSYVKGVTSAIQTQLNAKQGTLTLTTTGTSGAATLVGTTLNIPQYSGGGGGGMAIGGSITSATAGSVLFAGASGVLAQDNANFFWDDTNNRLGIGLTNPLVSLEVLGSTTNSSIKTGSIEIQGYAVNNCWIGDNIYWNGSSFIRRAAGYTSQFLFFGGEGQFRFGNSSTAGSVVNNGTGFGLVPFKMNVDGTVGIGGSMSGNPGDYTGAKLIVNSSGNTGINTLTIGSQLQVNGNAAIGYSASTAAPTNGLAVSGATTIGGDATISGVLRATITTNRQTASYTLVLADRGKLVEMNVATANNLTIPLNSSVAFPIGTQIDLSQYGAGQTTVVATSGVTIRSTNSWLKLNAQYAAATLIKIGTDEWYLFGNLNA